MILKKKYKEYLILGSQYFYYAMSWLIVMFFFLYGFVSYYNENTECTLTMNQVPLFFGEQKTIYTGSLRNIEAELGLPRYNFGLYADYESLKYDVLSRECRAIMPWSVIKNERETRSKRTSDPGSEFGFPGQEGFGEVLQS